MHNTNICFGIYIVFKFIFLIYYRFESNIFNVWPYFSRLKLFIQVHICMIEINSKNKTKRKNPVFLYCVLWKPDDSFEYNLEINAPTYVIDRLNMSIPSQARYPLTRLTYTTVSPRARRASSTIMRAQHSLITVARQPTSLNNIASVEVYGWNRKLVCAEFLINCHGLPSGWWYSISLADSMSTLLLTVVYGSSDGNTIKWNPLKSNTQAPSPNPVDKNIVT